MKEEHSVKNKKKSAQHLRKISPSIGQWILGNVHTGEDKTRGNRNVVQYKYVENTMN